jgi:hypothetical protein
MTVILPNELINHILSYRPVHPIAKIITFEFKYFNRHKDYSDCKKLLKGISACLVILQNHMYKKQLSKRMSNIRFYNTNNYTNPFIYGSSY